MKYRLFTKDQSTDDEPAHTLHGNVTGAEQGDVVFKYRDTVFVYADTDGETFVDFKEPEQVFDATDLIDDGPNREELVGA